MHQQTSKFADHPRITWFGRGGAVAYVDYSGGNESYCIARDPQGTFQVIPPFCPEGDEITGFATIDEGIEYALEARDRDR